jgi:hypothetical protein
MVTAELSFSPDVQLVISWMIIASKVYAGRIFFIALWVRYMADGAGDKKVLMSGVKTMSR